MTDSVQYLRAGGTYALSKSVAFLSTDVEATSSTYTPVTSTLTAKVEPMDADQRVDWTYEFVNASSTWAKGKTLTDYMTIAPKSDGSTELAVTCKKSFGEPIKITCTSRANSNIKASTVVDFLGVPELQTVMLGSGSNAITVNLGGETTVKWDIDGGKDYGGELIAGDYKASDSSVYTKLFSLDDFDVFNFDLVSCVKSNSGEYDLDGWYDDGYLLASVDDVLSGTIIEGTYEYEKHYFNDISVYGYNNLTSFRTHNLNDAFVFWYTYERYNGRTGKWSTVYGAEYFSDLTEEDTIAIFNTLSENSLYTFVLHTEIGGASKTYYSLMKLEIV
jgi:hypothetical protein